MKDVVDCLDAGAGEAEAEEEEEVKEEEFVSDDE